MTKVDVFSGICGFSTVIKAMKDGEQHIALTIESECEDVQALGDALDEVDPFQEMTYRGQGPRTLKMAQQVLPHPGCPVPVGIIKAVEVEGGLALPADATIKVSRDGHGN